MDKFPDLTEEYAKKVLLDNGMRLLMSLPNCPYCGSFTFKVQNVDDKGDIEIKCGNCEKTSLGITNGLGRIILKKLDKEDNWVKKLVRKFKRG